MYKLFIFEITNQIYYFYSLIVSPFFPQSLLLINLGKDQPSNVLSGDKKNLAGRFVFSFHIHNPNFKRGQGEWMDQKRRTR